MTKHPDSTCVVKVGDGRGFIIEQRIRADPRSFKSRGKFRLRPFVEEHTYPNLLGRLNGEKNSVWAECLFVDPIADIAVLGCPDDQALGNEAEGYNALIDGAPALLIGKARSGKGWLLALDGVHWIPTKLHLFSGMYGTSLATGPTKAGMSGSPVLNDRGCAVGVVCIGSETEDADGKRSVEEESGPQAILTHNLPGWLLELTVKRCDA